MPIPYHFNEDKKPRPVPIASIQSDPNERIGLSKIEEITQPGRIKLKMIECIGACPIMPEVTQLYSPHFEDYVTIVYIRITTRA